MNLFILFSTLLIAACNSSDSNNEMTFKIKKEMVAYFDNEKFEIHLNKNALKTIMEVDFSKYHFIEIENFSEKIPILDNTMSFRPPDVFIYRTQNQICFMGSIELKISHIDPCDHRIIELRKIFE